MAFEWWCGLLLGLFFGWLSHALLDWFLGLRGAHNRAQLAVSDLEFDRDKLRADYGGMERQVKEAHGLREKLERDGLEMRARLQEFDANAAELASLRLTLKDFDALTARVPVIQADLSHFKLRAEELEGQLGTRDRELEGLKAHSAEIEVLRTRTAALDEELRLAHADAEAERLRLEQIQTHHAAELDAGREALSVAQNAQGRLPELEALVASMRAKLGESSGLAAELRASETELEARNAELKALRTRVADLELGQVTPGNFEPQLTEVRARLETIETDRARIQTELSARENDLFDLAGKLNLAQGFQARAQKLEVELGARDRQLRALEAAPKDDTAWQRVSELERELAEARAGLAGAHATAARLASLESQHANLSVRLAELSPVQEHTVQLEDEIRALKANALDHESERAARQEERASHGVRLQGLEAQLSNSSAEIARLKTELEEARRTPDDLTRVDGIGAVFAKRLNAAGIVRFGQLAQLPPERLRAIIKPEDWQKIEFEHWTDDAAVLARGETPLKRARALERLARITGIGEVYEKRLHLAGITTHAELAATGVERLMEIAGSENRAEVELWITEAGAYAHGKRPNREREKVVRGRLSDAEDELDRLRGELRRAESLRRDRFEVMTQIGDAKQRRLYGAGIYLFEELARTPEDRLREIFEAADLDYGLISREAAEYARGEIIVVKGRRADRFERLTGFSEGDARALYAANIYSFEELARLSSAQLHEIIGRDGMDGSTTEAGLFATGQAQIEFIDAGKRHRDQLWRIDGIGEVFEGRLNRAGIFSFAELTAASPEGLREIIDPQTWERIDPVAWIAQARALGAEERES